MANEQNPQRGGMGGQQGGQRQGGTPDQGGQRRTTDQPRKDPAQKPDRDRSGQQRQ